MSNTEPLTPTDRAAINARLAAAIGWPRTAPDGVIVYQVLGKHGQFHDRYTVELPDFFTDATALRELAKCLSGQSAGVRLTFHRQALAMAVEARHNFSLVDSVFWLTCPLDVIARAADAAIGGKE